MGGWRVPEDRGYADNRTADASQAEPRKVAQLSIERRHEQTVEPFGHDVISLGGLVTAGFSEAWVDAFGDRERGGRSNCPKEDEDGK